jgi:glycosyltransferase involved in cell wall biosynthesis
MKKKKAVLSIITPVFNESNTVIELLSQVYNLKSDQFEKEMIVVESNSTDGSRKLVETFIKKHPNIKLILEDNPKGKGSAVRKGIAAATGDIIIIQDADLEYDVHDYDKLVKPIIEGKTAFVLGSRHLGEDHSFNWQIRKFKGSEIIWAYTMNTVAQIMDKAFNLLYGTKLTDPHTMFKVFSRNLVKQVHLEGEFFELDVELVSKFLRLGQMPIEIPVKYNSRSPNEGKKVRLLRDGSRMIKSILKYRFIDKKYL